MKLKPWSRIGGVWVDGQKTTIGCLWAELWHHNSCILANFIQQQGVRLRRKSRSELPFLSCHIPIFPWDKCNFLPLQVYHKEGSCNAYIGGSDCSWEELRLQGWHRDYSLDASLISSNLENWVLFPKDLNFQLGMGQGLDKIGKQDPLSKEAEAKVSPSESSQPLSWNLEQSSTLRSFLVTAGFSAFKALAL